MQSDTLISSAESESASFISPNPEQIEVLSDVGEGRALLIIFNDERYLALAQSTASALETLMRVMVIKIPPISHGGMEFSEDTFTAFLQAKRIRQASYVCFSSAANLLENHLLEEPKSVRMLVIVDAPSRPNPTGWDRLVDRVERILPLGLPLRLGKNGFNVRSYLHRIRCPLLVVTTPLSGAFVLGDAEVVVNSAPTAWRIAITDAELQAGHLHQIITEFQGTPAKCPQKNI